jgi:hypothetical protein
MELTFDRLVLPNAVTLPIFSKVVSAPHLRVDREGRVHGLGHPKRDAIGWSIPILWSVKVLTLPARGPRPTFKGESRITLRLMEDVDLRKTIIASQTSSLTASSRSFRSTSGDVRSPGLSPDYVAPSTSDIRTVPTITTSEPIKVVGANPFEERLSGQELTILLLKDSTGYMAVDYWMEGTQLHCLTLDGEHKTVPLGKLDLNETVRLNRERNVEVVLLSREGQH